MPATFPSDAPLRYPLQRTISAPTRVLEFLDGSEQRWRVADALNAFVLTFTEIPRNQVDALRTFLATVKGAYDSTWSLPVGSETFTDMALEQDDIAVVENTPNRYTVTLSMRQTVKSGTWSGASAVYPTITGGFTTQRPYTAKQRFLTTRNDLETGKRYAWYENSGALLRSWICSYPSISLTDLGTLLTFAVAMGGRHGAFDFTDPETGVTYTHCRLDTDDFSAQYVEPGQCAITLPVTEFVA